MTSSSILNYKSGAEFCQTKCGRSGNAKVNMKLGFFLGLQLTNTNAFLTVFVVFISETFSLLYNITVGLVATRDYFIINELFFGYFALLDVTVEGSKCSKGPWVGIKPRLLPRAQP